MKPTNLEYRLYAIRCARLDREAAAAAAAVPLWARIAARWQVWALWAFVELVALSWVAGLFK